MNFNQVSCGPCWTARNPDRVPISVLNTPPFADGAESSERCSWCGMPTNSGIYVRAHPDSVPFPQPDDGD